MAEYVVHIHTTGTTSAEATASLRLGDDSLCVTQGQGALEGLVDVVGTLHRAGDGDAAIGSRLGDHGLVLDVELLLVADPVLALHDQRGLGERVFDVASTDLVGGELLLRFERIEHRRQRFGLERQASPGLSQCGLVRRRDERDGLAVVADDLVSKGGLIVLDGAHDVVARDVGRREDHHTRPVESGVLLDTDESVLSLVTCYPFDVMQAGGPMRYVVSARMIF